MSRPNKTNHLSKDFSEGYTRNPFAFREMHDLEKRTTKARKILAVIEDCCGSLGNLSLLDLSCSTGVMAQTFSTRFSQVTGIDLDRDAIAYAEKNHPGPNIRYLHMDALHTSFDSGSFDVLVCNQMYEHVSDAHLLMTEIQRLLKPGGFCYFGASNRLMLIEPHYGRIPLLSIVPRPLASLVLRVLKRSDRYRETHLTYWGLKRLVTRFEVIDYSGRVIDEPIRFHATDQIRPGGLKQAIARLVCIRANWLMPGYIWMLRKPTLERGTE